MVREIKERFGFVHDVNEQALVQLPIDGKPVTLDVTEPLKGACKTVLKPIIDAVRQMVSKFDPGNSRLQRQ